MKEKTFKSSMDNYIIHDENNDIIETVKFKEDGVVALMCPKCFRFRYRKFNMNFETALQVMEINKDHELYDLSISLDTIIYAWKCPYCGAERLEQIPIDPNIAEIISQLNIKGYVTKFCCEGHGTNNGYIYFNGKYNKYFENIFNTLPLSWFVDLNDLKEDCVIIRSDAGQYPSNLKELGEWVESLDNITGGLYGR